MAERYVVLGLGTARSPWFTEVARWATVGSIPADFVKCIGAEEMRVRLTSGRTFSALLIDATTGALDRDLLDTARRHGAAVLVVDGREEPPWLGLGAAAVLDPAFGRADLLDALDEHATMVAGANDQLVGLVEGEISNEPRTQPGRLVAVLGSGGAGASTVAMATAQGLSEFYLAPTASAGRQGVVLADMCLDAELAMLHDARDIVPGVQELVDAHRGALPSPAEVHSLTFDVVNRGYKLLLGLRRHRDWAALRPRSFEAALGGLLEAFDLVVADIDADLEGEDECGSADVEERNLMARTIVSRADVVVAVGGPGVKGLHGLVRTVIKLRDHGVAANHVLTVLNRSARTPRARADVARSLADLSGARAGVGATAGPIHLPDRRGLDEVMRDGGRLPAAITDPLTRAVSDLLVRAGSEPRSEPQPVAITPGELGSWTEQEAMG